MDIVDHVLIFMQEKKISEYIQRKVGANFLNKETNYHLKALLSIVSSTVGKTEWIDVALQFTIQIFLQVDLPRKIYMGI